MNGGEVVRVVLDQQLPDGFRGQGRCVVAVGSGGSALLGEGFAETVQQRRDFRP